MAQPIQKTSDLLRPHRPHRLFPLCFVSESTRTAAKRIFDYLVQDELSPADIEEIKRLVDEATPQPPPTSGAGSGLATGDVRHIFNVINWDGFTLLQRAVIGDHLAIIKLLAKRGVDVNAGICSLPLHLACRLGRTEAVSVLLSYGARLDVESTVCYPDEHKLKTCPDQIYCLAYQPGYTPVAHTLAGDHAAVLCLLITRAPTAIRTDFLLHSACRVGAIDCLRYLLRNYASQLAVVDGDGRTPLQISLAMDTDSAIFLVDNGAKIEDSVFLTYGNGSTLHELYRCKVTLGLVKATKFALEHGFRNHINARDREGNTALYVLLRHVGRTVKTAIQSDYDAEVRESIQLLLANGANPNAPNRSGESALHALFADGVRRPLYVMRHGQVRRLKPTLHEISTVVDILLSHGADAAQRASPLYATPLHCAAHIFESLQPDMFVVVKGAFQQLFLQLCRDGGAACVNAVDAYGVPVFVLLLNAARRWLTSGAAASNVVGHKCTTFIARMLQHFLRHGLDPNIVLTMWAPRGVNGRVVITSNYFREIAAFVSIQVPSIDAQFYDEARRLLVILAQRGGNPNLVTFHSIPPHSDSPLAQNNSGSFDISSISCMIARALLGNQNSIALAGTVYIVDFFCKTLSQAKLRELSDGVNFYVANSLPVIASPATRSILLRLSTTTPRPLRLLCRIAIANHMKWRLAKRCGSLPLPRSMLHSLISFDT